MLFPLLLILSAEPSHRARHSKPVLTAEERQYFAQQLQSVVTVVQAKLEEKGLHCVLRDTARGQGDGGLAEWVAEKGHATPEGYAPDSWSRNLKCTHESTAAVDLGVSLAAIPLWVPTTTQVAVHGDSWTILELTGAAGRRQTQTLDFGAMVSADPSSLPPPAHPPLLAQAAAGSIWLSQSEGTLVALELLQAVEPVAMGALKDLRAIPTPASDLTPVQQLSRSTFNPAERQYFAAQLERVLAHAQKELTAQGLSCSISDNAPDGKTRVPAERIPSKADLSRFGYSPKPWLGVLQCARPSRESLRIAVSLSAAPEAPPLRPFVVSSGEGWTIGSMPGNQPSDLIFGDLVEADPNLLALPEPRAVLARARAGRITLFIPAPASIAILKALSVPSLLAGLQEAQALKPPATDMVLEEQDPVAVGPAEVPYTPSDGPEPKPVKVVFDKADRQTRIPPLEMVLLPEERAYFATVRARAFTAASAALKAAGRRCELQRDSRQAELPETAELSRLGAAPREWDFDMKCYDAKLASVTVMVHLLAEWQAQSIEGSTTESLAPDVALQQWTLARLAMANLVVGKLGPPVPPVATPDLVVEIQPGLMRLGAVELSVFGTSQAEADPLLHRADLAPLRALVKSPPRPPAPRSPVVDGPAPTTPREAVEQEVYRAVLETELVGGSGKTTQVVVDAELGGQSLSSAMAKIIKADCPDLLGSAIEDFDRVVATPGEFPADFTWRLPVTRLTRDAHQAFFKAMGADGGKVDGWKLFRDTYPRSAGILSFSRVGLSRDQTQAIVSIGWQADWLAGSGDVWFLRHSEKGWVVVYKSHLWVS